MKLRSVTIIMFTLACLLFTLSSCNQETPDPQKAQDFIEAFMNKVNKGDMSDLANYYSEEMNNGETDETRVKKFDQLKQVLGESISFTLLEKKQKQSEDTPPQVKFTYEVKHQKQTVIETYSVIKEGNDYKIAGQNTVSKSAWVQEK